MNRVGQSADERCEGNKCVYWIKEGARGSIVEALCYKLEGCRFKSR
jgi:hypothetical protein